MAAPNLSDNFDAPIPGMSLTAEPKSRPWQRPPQYVELDDVVGYYLEKIGDADSIRKANFVLEDTRIPVNVMVDTLITAGMMEGIHTVAMGTLVAPVIREFIIANAEIDGIDFVKSVDEMNEGKIIGEIDERMFMKALRESQMSDMQAPVVEEATEEAVAKPAGLMQRPTKEEMM
jgi:hypothetical protein